MKTQTARVTFLTTSEFKAWIKNEAKNLGVSVSEFIQLRCEAGPTVEELLLTEMTNELRKATLRAKASLDKAMKKTRAVLNSLSDNK